MLSISLTQVLDLVSKSDLAAPNENKLEQYLLNKVFNALKSQV